MERARYNHAGPWQALYAQLASFSVREGDCVAPGTVIGTFGATGLATAPLLHFEVRHNRQPIDPMVLPSRLEGSGIKGKHQTQRSRFYSHAEVSNHAPASAVALVDLKKPIVELAPGQLLDGVQEFRRAVAATGAGAPLACVVLAICEFP